MLVAIAGIWRTRRKEDADKILGDKVHNLGRRGAAQATPGHEIDVAVKNRRGATPEDAMMVLRIGIAPHPYGGPRGRAREGAMMKGEQVTLRFHPPPLQIRTPTF